MLGQTPIGACERFSISQLDPCVGPASLAGFFGPRFTDFRACGPRPCRFRAGAGPCARPGGCFPCERRPCRPRHGVVRGPAAACGPCAGKRHAPADAHGCRGRLVGHGRGACKGCDGVWGRRGCAWPAFQQRSGQCPACRVRKAGHGPAGIATGIGTCRVDPWQDRAEPARCEAAAQAAVQRLAPWPLLLLRPGAGCRLRRSRA